MSSLSSTPPGTLASAGSGPAAAEAVASASAVLREAVCVRACSHSIATRLSRKLALFTIVIFGVLLGASWASVSMLLKEHNAKDLRLRTELLADRLSLAAKAGGEGGCVARLIADAPLRASSRVELRTADGRLVYEDPLTPAFATCEHCRERRFTISVPGAAAPYVGLHVVDFSNYAEMGRRWAWILTAVSLIAGCIVAAGAAWHVRRGLQPLARLAEQTRAISPQDLSRRLSLDDPAEELLPWIEQFNALMDRLERAVAQLEGFNADVAHELRTPLANLIGQTEVVLSRDRPAAELCDTLVSNLEELQRLSAMVNDMLFLSHADRGAAARRGEPVSLAELARQVVEFHEAPLEEAGLTLAVDGDARLAVDESLVKRALSNLIGNATRFATRGSTVRVRITPEAGGGASLVVENAGEAIDPAALPRLFDRFFRADSSRNCPQAQQHHGLGLAIVAAIARMHAGRPQAESAGGLTRIGFTLAA